MENKFLDKIILNLLSVLKNGNTEVVSECNEICEISISDTITLNFRNFNNFYYYVANIISFYKGCENKQFNEIIIKNNNNEIKYNSDLDILLVYNNSFDKFYRKSEFIVKLMENVKKLNIEIKRFGYISNDFKFEFTSGSDVYIYVKNHSSEIIIQDGNYVELNAFHDMQDAILSMFCELNDIIDIKPVLRKYVSENKLKMIENKQFLLDIISWYVILGGDVSSDEFNIDFEGIIINSFRLFENITSYKSNFYTPVKTREKLYYSFDGDSVVYWEKDVHTFYNVSDVVADFEKNEDIEKTCEKIIKNNPTDFKELMELDTEKQVQFTKNFSKFDISPNESLKALIFFANHNYGMFRSGLETLDLSPTLYKILDNSVEQMGYWLPKVAGISSLKIPNTKIIKVPLSLLQLGRVFEYGQLTPTTFKIINEYCKKVFELDLNGTYFIKNGVFSSKFDFRNAKVTTPQEVSELGQYLFYIHQQACQMASLLNNKSIYGCGTTTEWVVREYIESPIKETIYMGLPLNTEYRIFVDFDTKTIISDNQYWNKEVMNKRFKENRNNHDIHDVITYNMASERLEKTYKENINKVRDMVQELLDNNIEMTGQWSIDIMQVENDFYLIDMALAENSFYYNSVPKELRKPTTEKWLELQ